MDCCREARLARAPATRREMAYRMSEVRDRRLEAMELVTRLCAWLKPSSCPFQIRPWLTNKEGAMLRLRRLKPGRDPVHQGSYEYMGAATLSLVGNKSLSEP